MTDWLPRQLEICDRFGASFLPSSDTETLGIARNTNLRPLNGLRHPPESDTCGWYLWGGVELSQAPDFFEPVHVSHLETRCPLALPFLGLGPGWRFLLDGDQVDVWFDPNLLKVERS